MLPWFDRPIIYDVRTRPNVIQSTSGSKDLQMVTCCDFACHTDSMTAGLSNCGPWSIVALSFTPILLPGQHWPACTDTSIARKATRDLQNTRDRLRGKSSAINHPGNRHPAQQHVCEAAVRIHPYLSSVTTYSQVGVCCRKHSRA